MSFLLYAIGFVVLVTGLAWLATIAGVPQAYILGGVAAMIGVGAFTALANASARDPA